MKGCRPLTNNEIKKIDKSFSGTMAYRDRALFYIGLLTGFRISEILSLKISNILNTDGSFVHEIRVERNNMKGQKESRSIEFSLALTIPLQEWLQDMRIRGNVRDSDYLFCTRSGNQLYREGALRAIKKAYRNAGIFDLPRRLATHTLRKTFCNMCKTKFCEMREKNPVIDPVQLTMEAMGHKRYDTTIKYISFEEKDVTAGIRAIADNLPL